MEEKKYMDPQDVANTMGISRSYAYKVIRTLNNELKEKGFLTVSGKVNRQYFLERTCYGTKQN